MNNLERHIKYSMYLQCLPIADNTSRIKKFETLLVILNIMRGFVSQLVTIMSGNNNNNNNNKSESNSN